LTDKVKFFCDIAFCAVGSYLLVFAGYLLAQGFEPFIVIIYIFTGVFIVRARVRYDEEEEVVNNE